MSDASPTPGPSKPPTATLKKQPKNATRKSKAERDRLEKEEAKRYAERLRAAQADERAAEASRKAAYGFTEERGGRGGRGSSRGGADATRGRLISRAGRGGRGGFMSAGVTPRGVGGANRAGTARAGYKRESGTGRVSVKADPDGDVAMLGVPVPAKRERERERNVYEIDSEDDDVASHMDIEHFRDAIYIHGDDSDEDQESDTGRGKGIRPTPKAKPAREMGALPVRVTRKPHEERQIGINTEASALSVADAKRLAENQEGDKSAIVAAAAAPIKRSKSKGKEVQYVGENQMFRGVYLDEDDNNVTIKPDPDSHNGEAHEDGKAKTKTATRTRRKSSIRRAKSPVMQTAEEVREQRIQSAEAEIMREELLDIPMQQTKSGATLEGDIAQREPASQADAVEEERYDRRKDNVYLFQLPPVMPGLVSAASKVKQEKPAASTEATGKDAAAPSTGQPKPSTTESKLVKIEDDGSDNISGSAKRGAFEPGCVGKLRVHRSGKTSLSWGGTSLQLSMGIDGRFLQSVVLMELPDNEHTATNVAAGRALSFGSVRGKFVVTPDWSEILR